jgi:hypothetical protein
LSNNYKSQQQVGCKIFAKDFPPKYKKKHRSNEELIANNKVVSRHSILHSTFLTEKIVKTVSKVRDSKVQTNFFEID